MVSGSEQLRDWMDRRTVNQRAAAELLGITEVFLSQLVNAKRQPGLANAIKIERMTGISVESWLLTGVNESAEPDSPEAVNDNQTKR